MEVDGQSVPGPVHPVKWQGWDLCALERRSQWRKVGFGARETYEMLTELGFEKLGVVVEAQKDKLERWLSCCSCKCVLFVRHRLR